MLNKKILLLLFISVLSVRCFSQDLIEKKEKLSDRMTAIYTVLKSDEQTKDGLYQEFYRRKHLIVSGVYKNGKKIGVWRYFNPNGVLMQTYNIEKDSIVYEAFERRPSAFNSTWDPPRASPRLRCEPPNQECRYAHTNRSNTARQ